MPFLCARQNGWKRERGWKNLRLYSDLNDNYSRDYHGVLPDGTKVTWGSATAGVGAAGAFLLVIQAGTLDWKRTKEAVFLTAKTTAMVCWLFVGSALFSAVFAILGGQALLESWVLSLATRVASRPA